MPNGLYLDDELKILNPQRRDLEPERGARGFGQVMVRSIDDANRTVNAIASTPNVDRYGEIVLPEAFRKSLPGFMRNPVLVAGHQYIGPSGEPTVIGQWTALEAKGDGLHGTAKFLTGDPLADAYWLRYQQRAMRSFSVGWITNDFEMRDFTAADGTKKKIRVFTDVELIEISAVSIPANRESLVKGAGFARAAGMVDDFLSGSEGGEVGDLLGEIRDGLSGDDVGGLSNRRLNKLIHKQLAPLIQRELRKHLDPVPEGALCAFIGEVVEATIQGLANRGHLHGIRHSSLGDAEPPDPYGPAPGEGELMHDEEANDPAGLDVLTAQLSVKQPPKFGAKAARHPNERPRR